MSVRGTRAFAAFGIALGLGLYTVRYAEALSYLGDDPRAWANCHITRRQFEVVQRPARGGRDLQRLPHLARLVGKYVSKALNSFYNSRAVTLQHFASRSRSRSATRALHASCVSCHGELVVELHAARGALEDVRCLSCHRSVGHGSTR
jgi:hypothetical protein